MRYKFGTPDREQYGDDWYEVHPWRLDWETPGMAALVERFEDATGYTIAVTFPAALLRGAHRALRAAMWLGLLLAGRDDTKFDAFWPRQDLAEFEPDDGDGDADPKPATAKKTRKSTKTSGRSTANPSANT